MKSQTLLDILRIGSSHISNNIVNLHAGFFHTTCLNLLCKKMVVEKRTDNMYIKSAGVVGVQSRLKSKRCPHGVVQKVSTLGCAKGIHIGLCKRYPHWVVQKVPCAQKVTGPLTAVLNLQTLFKTKIVR